MAKTKRRALMPIERITHSILIVRGQRVLLDSELADLYGVPTKRFNEQVRRNLKRFPADFMFQLTLAEATDLRSQFATSRSHGGRRYAPHAFTEHGAIMAATILNSTRAIEMSVYVVRAFVQLRDVLASNKELARRLDQLESKFASHDQTITDIIKSIRALMNRPPLPEPKRRGIRFTANFDDK